MEDVRKKIAERIREERIKRGLSQEALANKCGYKSRSTINKIEQGTRSMTLESAKRIAGALDIDADYILFGNEDVNDTKDEINRLFDSLTPDQQDQILAFLRSMLGDRAKGL